MVRLLSALAVISLCVLFASAQEAPRSPVAPAKRVASSEDVPILITEAGGKPAWKLRGTVDVSLFELMSAWVKTTGISMSVPANLNTLRINYEAPQAGTMLSGDAITTFVSDMLAPFRLALAGASLSRPVIVQLQDAPTFARTVDNAELAAMPDYEWVVWYSPLRFADANATRGAMQNFMSRSGGMINSVPGANGIMIADRADHVRQLAKLIATLDSPGQNERTIEKYDLPEGVDAAGAAVALKALTRDVIAAGPGKPDTNIEVGVVPGKNRLLVKGTSAQHAEVKRAIELMK